MPMAAAPRDVEPLKSKPAKWGRSFSKAFKGEACVPHGTETFEILRQKRALEPEPSCRALDLSTFGSRLQCALSAAGHRPEDWPLPCHTLATEATPHSTQHSHGQF